MLVFTVGAAAMRSCDIAGVGAGGTGVIAGMVAMLVAGDLVAVADLVDELGATAGLETGSAVSLADLFVIVFEEEASWEAM